MTQASASTIFDLPEPFGPTTALMPGVNSNVVAEAKDLKPRRVSECRCTGSILPVVVFGPAVIFSYL